MSGYIKKLGDTAKAVYNSSSKILTLEIEGKVADIKEDLSTIQQWEQIQIWKHNYNL